MLLPLCCTLYLAFDSSEVLTVSLKLEQSGFLLVLYIIHVRVKFLIFKGILSLNKLS